MFASIKFYRSVYRISNGLSALSLRTRQLHCTSCRSKEFPPMPHILKQNNISEADKRKIEDEVAELTKYSFMMVSVISLFTCGVAFYLWYRPKQGYGEWAQLEAFLELERRRRDGLPLIDPDLVPRSQVKLPSDEELGSDFKIII